MSNSNLKSVHVIVSGRVQGVGFRAWTTSQAKKRHLNGWVRNCDNGTVEAVFAGKAAQVDDMLAACQDGPLASRVKEVNTKPWTEAVAQGFERKSNAPA